MGPQAAPRGGLFVAMGNQLPDAPLPSAAEQELALRRDELRRLDAQVVDREMKLASLQDQVEVFLHQKLLRLGPLYVAIDRLKLKIARAELARDPDNPVLQRRVQEAEARLGHSDEAARSAAEVPPLRELVLTSDLRRVYRDAARRMHPDHARGPEERDLRNQFMARLNAAYSACDIEALQDVIAAWEAKGPPPGDVDVQEGLRRVLSAIERFRLTLDRIEGGITALRERPEYALMVESYRAQENGVDMFADQQKDLMERKERLEAKLRALEERDA